MLKRRETDRRQTADEQKTDGRRTENSVSSIGSKILLISRWPRKPRALQQLGIRAVICKTFQVISLVFELRGSGII